MTLQECYAALNGNYEEAIGRLRSERLVQKFVLKFLTDDSYPLLCRSLESQDYQEAFRAAHTLKGVCQNLSFIQLGQSSSSLTEALRNGWDPAAAGLVDQVHADYRQTVQAIQTFQNSLGT